VEKIEEERWLRRGVEGFMRYFIKILYLKHFLVIVDSISKSPEDAFPPRLVSGQ